MGRKTFLACAALVAALAILGAPTAAQVTARIHVRSFAANVVVPQSRVVTAAGRAPAVKITGVNVGVAIAEQAATTTMDILLSNPSGRPQQAELLVPVPAGAAVHGFTFEGKAKEPAAEVLPKEEAKKTYDAIVAKMRDPALLEFIGCNLVRSSVFPVPARGKQRVRLVYEHLLTVDGNRVDYVLPRTESVNYNVPWTIAVHVKTKRPLSTVYSPSHELDVKRAAANAVTARLKKTAGTQPGAFRLSYLLEGGGLTASLLAYPDPKIGGGYFLLLAGLPAEPPKGAPAIRREVTLVIDRSGSMNGEKIEQVREAALQILAGLKDGEAFNVIAYNDAVHAFSPAPVVKNADSIRKARAYLKDVRAGGGTNIHDALLEALRPKPTKGMLPIALFLTDGLPTVGVTSEVKIRALAVESNPYKRRVFTFGVGVDVNTPLLERIALESRAAATFVMPKEDVEVKVASVFRRLSGPVVASPALAVVKANGEPASGRVRDVLPSKLPDLFAGDQLVVLGKYKGEEKLHFRLDGNYLGKPRRFRFAFGLDKATTKNAFVPRLWASRRIGVLVDAVRALGADSGASFGYPKAAKDPRMKELVDEIVKLSREFGILTEYTAFLAREGTDLGDRDAVLKEARKSFASRAIGARVGLASVNQEYNRSFMRSQTRLNLGNEYYDAGMNRVAVTSIQQVNDRAFYNRGGRWVDSRIVQDEAKVKPRRTIRFGSEAFRALAQRLARENRAGCIALRGDILMSVDGQAVLVTRGPGEGK
jgi:Ca-activated chloride channel family protein